MTLPFEGNDVEQTPTSTEDSAERGYADERGDTRDPATYADLGRSDVLDFDDEGDIADEGRGHRG